jgi:hypothetical protein
MRAQLRGEPRADPLSADVTHRLSSWPSPRIGASRRPRTGSARAGTHVSRSLKLGFMDPGARSPGSRPGSLGRDDTQGAPMGLGSGLDSAERKLSAAAPDRADPDRGLAAGRVRGAAL